MAALEVRLQTLDGVWETIGVDRYPGVTAEGFQAGSNEWGYDTCSFTLRRPTDVEHPDLASFTPCDVYRGGSFVWEGRVKETPTTDGPDGQINVTGVGWQAHTDDDLYERSFIQTDLTTAVDNRTLLQADLSILRTGAHVEAGTGGILVGWDAGSVMNGSGFASCAVVDMGADRRRWASHVSLDWEVVSGAGDAAFVFEVWVTDGGISPLETGRRAVYQPGDWSAVSGGTNVGGTASSPGRYVHFFCFYDLPAATLGADRIARVKRMLIATDAAYQSGGASVLKASTVVTDAFDIACPLLSTDRSQIQATSFNLPEFALDGPHTARDVVTAANAVHRWRTRIKRGRIPEFAPLPNAPLFKVGSWGGSRFQDASVGSGEEIYNRVLVTGTGPDGVELTAERKSSSFSPAGVPQPANGSFDTNTSGWSTAGFMTLARDTGVYSSAPASMSVSDGAIQRKSSLSCGDIPGPWTPGRRYRLSARLSASASGVLIAELGGIYFKDANGNILNFADTLRLGSWEPPVGSFQTHTWEYICPPGTVTVAVSISYTLPGSTTFWIDDVAMEAADGTLVDRRGFIRTKQLAIGSALTTPLANQLGDVFLATHARTPLKGSIEIQPTGLRSVATDEEIHPSELLNMPTELIRLSHLIDPDTGALGRDGIIASVSYSEDSETASVQLDNDRRSLENLLARMAIVTGSART